MIFLTIKLGNITITLGGAFMCNGRKEEILARSRNAKEDEGVEHAKLKGNKLGEYTMAAVVVPIMIFAFLIGELTAFLAVGAGIAAFTFAQCLTEYRFTKRKYHLAWTIFTAIAVIACTVLFVSVSLGWWEPKAYIFGLLPL